jgi:nucleoside-diphosphate-sugar epimerase
MRCADIAKKAGCKKYLCAGTIAERSIESLEDINITSGGMMYGAAKYANHIMIETYCKNIGLDFIWMQFSNIYGPDNRTGNLISYTLGQLIKGEPASFGPANQAYDFIYIDDLIEAVYRLGVNETKSNCYFIGSGTPRLLSDYLIEVGEIYEKPELIKIGERPDDQIKYSFDMMDTSRLVNDIGKYVSESFEKHIRYAIQIS